MWRMTWIALVCHVVDARASAGTLCAGLMRRIPVAPVQHVVVDVTSTGTL